jgi:DNA repair exonuclease SbcCD nuclease subunit
MVNYTTLGDVHLGRKFVTGVPKHRLGEREQSVWTDFIESVLGCITPLHIQVGDLFDAFIVPPEVVLKAAEIYKSAPKNITYIVYRGNHDASRDADKKSSFDLFCELMLDTPNVMVVKESPERLGEYGFIPWHPFRSAQEQAELLKTRLAPDEKLSAVFGHFDIESFGGSEFNVLPAASLGSYTGGVVTGHIHTPSTFQMGELEVVVTGSMQPYSHGEDKGETLYVTRTLEQVMADTSAFKNLNLRIILPEGQDVPEDIDCLSLIVKKENSSSNPEEIEVEFEDFNMGTLFSNCLREQGVIGGVAEKVLAKFAELKNA